MGCATGRILKKVVSR